MWMRRAGPGRHLRMFPARSHHPLTHVSTPPGWLTSCNTRFVRLPPLRAPLSPQLYMAFGTTNDCCPDQATWFTIGGIWLTCGDLTLLILLVACASKGRSAGEGGGGEGGGAAALTAVYVLGSAGACALPLAAN